MSDRTAVLCIANQKGGVGKTTTAIQLAHCLAREGGRVLLVDLDAQGNAGSIFLEEEPVPERSVYAVFKDRSAAPSLVQQTRVPGLDLLPSVFHLAEVETLLAGAVDGFFRLSESIGEASGYDFIVIDCPPNLGVLTVNAFVSGTHVIIPLQTAKFSLDGIQGILDTFETIHKRFNPRLRVLGALLTMFNERTTISQALLGSIEEHIPLFRTRIDRAVAVEEAHMLRQTVLEYQPRSKVSRQYQEFAREVRDGLQEG